MAEDDAAGSKSSGASKRSVGHDAEAGDIHAGGLFDEDDDDNDGPGPLTLAASAARIEAEARIRAAMMQARGSAAQHPESGYHDDHDDLQTHFGPAEFEDEPEIAVAWGRPPLTIQHVSESDVVPLGARPEDFDDADDDDDEDGAAQGRSDRSLSGYVRRSRLGRGYSIPRLSKSKRTGAVPGG